MRISTVISIGSGRIALRLTGESDGGVFRPAIVTTPVNLILFTYKVEQSEIRTSTVLSYLATNKRKFRHC